MSNSNKLVSGTFAATGSSEKLIPVGSTKDAACAARVNITLSGTFVGTVVLERSFDGGATYVGVNRNGSTAISYTAPVSENVEETEGGVCYRLRCSAYTSGTVTYRMSV